MKTGRSHWKSGPAMIGGLVVSTILLLVGLGTLGLAQEKSSAKPQYTVTALSTLGGTFNYANGVNDRGWVAGAANLTGDQTEHATLWRNGLITDLGTLGGLNSVAFPAAGEEDSRGLIVGMSQTSTVDPLGEEFCPDTCTPSGVFCQGDQNICVGFLWQNGMMTALPTLGGNNGYALGVNSSGLVVGLAENSTHGRSCIAPQVLDFEAVIWGPEKGQIQELPPFPGDSVAAAVAINDNGQIVGGSGICAPVSPAFSAHAVLWQDGSVSDLGSFGGMVNNLAFAINDRGQVVGALDLPGDTTGHAFLWQDGLLTDLGTLPGDFSSLANGINDRGQVVGQSCDASGNCRVFLWENGVMTDLNTLIQPGSSLTLMLGSGINDFGEIAGEAFDRSNDEMLGFLATPTDGEAASGRAAPTGQNETTPDSEITLPENVRQSLQRRLRLGPFGGRLTTPQ